jgi:hypothetical protein
MSVGRTERIATHFLVPLNAGRKVRDALARGVRKHDP